MRWIVNIILAALLIILLIGCEKEIDVNNPASAQPEVLQKEPLINETWEDFTFNPVLSSTNSSWDKYGPHQCKILRDEGDYHMWFGNLILGAVNYIGYAYSNDGITWTRPVNHPVMSPGPIGSWDAGAVISGPVLRERNIFKMYYNGWKDQNGLWQVGYATSSDGINWQKKPEPILWGNGNDARIIPADIIRHGNTYYLYYHYGLTNTNSPNYKIGVAISSDGINFTKYSGNPIVQKSETWERLGVTYPSIIKDKGMYYMYYSNDSESIINALGIAYSKDGLSWTKANNNPFFSDTHSSITWKPDKVVYPYVLKMKEELRIYYTGQKGNNPGFRHIGFLTRIK